MSFKRWIVISVIFALAVIGSFRSGYQFGEAGLTFSPSQFKVVGRDSLPTNVDYSLLGKALEVLDSNYIERPIDQQKALYGAVRGAVAAAGDDYTQFFDPEELAEFHQSLKGSFDGIGAEINRKNGLIVVVAPIEDSPAQKAGLLAKDIIIEVDGASTVDWSVEEAVRKIRGEKGTEVKLLIAREGRTKPFELAIKRDTILIKTVKWEIKQVAGKKIGIIRLSRFGEDTKEVFSQAVGDLKKQNISGLIVDVRNNPGGYLETSIDVASHWLAKDRIVVDEARSDTPAVQHLGSYGYNEFAGLKTIVLVNGGSASAAEILAGALRDHKAAILVGEKTFGKGSVQEVIDLPDNTALKVTIAKWITPAGIHLNKDGLVPDIEVKMTEEDYAAEKDPQMDKALEEVVK